MKKLLLSIIIFFSLASQAQQVTFQGKLFENGKVVNGQRVIDFYIGSPVNWDEKDTVQVTNGLYAVVLGAKKPLPLWLFKTSNSRRLEIRITGNPIDTVTIYAPFERDYTVPDSIKDGISWNEVSGKPTIDTSPTNEFQTLSLKGDSLSISNGNKVKLSALSNGNFKDINIEETLKVGKTDTLYTSTVSQTTLGSSKTKALVWQSFIAPKDGRLIGVKLNFGLLGSANYVKLKIYKGVYAAQPAIFSQDITKITPPSTLSIVEWRLLDLSAYASKFPTGMNLVAGDVYSFSVEVPSGTSNFIDARVATSTPNSPYPYGKCNFNSDEDLVFEIIQEQFVYPCLQVTNSCNVGIGKNAPTAKLEVNGRIKDQTGFVMPVGSILSFAGENAPEGWLLCNGDSISRLKYIDLFSVIGTAWGQGDGVTTFNLPDLRGRFLRGVDGIAGNDPDNDKRYNLFNGGNKANNVGSYQDQEIKRHSHTTNAVHGTGSNSNVPLSGAGGSNIHTSNNYGGNETRPINAYVNYIIKY
jgi:microcystin-dependent protein